MRGKIGPVHIFISWAQEDELQKQELLKHLNSLVSIGTISVWAGEFSYGIRKNKQVAENLEKAEIFLPLVSADYFKDKDCERELEEAVARYSNDNIRLIPVLLRTCPWQPYFRDIDLPPVLPRNAVSVMEGPKPDKAYTEIVETIAQVVEELRTGSLREQKNDYQHPPKSLSPLPSSTARPQLMEEIGTFENKLAFAVIIGVANYPNVSQLSDVVLKDARDIRSLLRSPECGYLESNVKLLLDRKATSDAIHDKLDWIAKTATPESAAIIFFSGHGLRLQTDSQTIHYLLPYNYDPMDIEKTAISGEKLTGLLNAIKIQRLLVIFDCCHSGGTGETKAAEPLGTLKVSGKEFKYGFEEQYLAQLAKGTGRVIMASSRPDEPAYILPGMDNSLFTHYLLEALRGKAFTRGDGLIRVFDVFDHVSEKVPTRRSQHPIFKAEVENNFPIALYQGGQKMDLNQNLSIHQNTEVDRTTLREVMSDAFSRTELETLCADVEQSLRNDGIRERVSLDAIGGANEGIENIIYKMIEYLNRRNYLGYLVRILRRKRPGII